MRILKMDILEGKEIVKDRRKQSGPILSVELDQLLLCFLLVPHDVCEFGVFLFPKGFHEIELRQLLLGHCFLHLPAKSYLFVVLELVGPFGVLVLLLQEFHVLLKEGLGGLNLSLDFRPFLEHQLSLLMGPVDLPFLLKLLGEPVSAKGRGTSCLRRLSCGP